MTRRARAFAGPALFVAVTLALTWASALCLTSAWTSDGPVATRLLRASLLYAAVVGWQPLVALLIVRRSVDRDWLARARHATPSRYTWLAIGVLIVLLLGAAIVDALLGGPARAPAGQPVEATWGDAAFAICAFVGVLAVLWLQAIIEEIAWRGYLLPRVMQAAGPWRGLFLHGVLWGACYAPVFLVGASPGELARTANFIVTCGLLGVLLGWLRLASGTVAASATCNATLTICAGLPLVLQGMTPILGALFEPAGWLPMLLVILLIASRPSLRAAVAVPQQPLPDHLN